MLFSVRDSKNCTLNSTFKLFNLDFVTNRWEFWHKVTIKKSAIKAAITAKLVNSHSKITRKTKKSKTNDGACGSPDDEEAFQMDETELGASFPSSRQDNEQSPSPLLANE